MLSRRHRSPVLCLLLAIAQLFLPIVSATASPPAAPQSPSRPPSATNGSPAGQDFLNGAGRQTAFSSVNNVQAFRPELASITGNATQFQGTNVIDISQLTTPGFLTFPGNLYNSGTLYIVSTNAAVTTAQLTALNIVNATNATISTVIPAGGLPQVNDANSRLNLVLNAANNIWNAGTISAAGSLTLTAGNSITNAAFPATGSPTQLPGPAITPMLQSVHDLSLFAPNITNAGLVSSQSNLNVANSIASNLVISNQGGRFEAVSGVINVQSALSSINAFAPGCGENFALTVSGGAFAAGLLNFSSGSGSLTVNTEALNGLVNVTGRNINVQAKGEVNMGQMIAIGDPHIEGDIVTLSNWTYTNEDAFLYVWASQMITGTASRLIADPNTVYVSLNSLGPVLLPGLKEASGAGGVSVFSGGQVDLGLWFA